MPIPTPPRWDLTNVYPGLESDAFRADLAAFGAQVDDFAADLAVRVILDAGAPVAELAQAVATLVERANEASARAATLRAYLNSFVSTDSFNQLARKLNSQLDVIMARWHTAATQLQSWIGQIAPALPEVIAQGGVAAAHAFFLRESAEQSRYLMSAPEESLASELYLSGAGAWSKLQGTVVSQLSVPFELDGQAQQLAMPALINLHSHPDAAVRRRAYEAEMAAWEMAKEPLAACMNGIKGAVNTLNRRRGREDALHAALDAARIDRQTLSALLGAMRGSFPMFRRYFQSKAAKLGEERLPWWDLFAPVGRSDKVYPFEEARAFILEHFASFSSDLAELARRAFDQRWIDAEQRLGKRGGAFCMAVPGVKESRVFCNYDGSLNQVTTIAHELGHAFHGACMFRAGKTELQRRTPMTLAETASILCETIVVDAAIARAADAQEELAILETDLCGAAQVIVDISSRFVFEQEVFERRAQAELSAEELCAIMENAQKETYGEGLDERALHKYMWTWKPHYYSAGLSFYNFPYAFGLLFGTGLYAIYRQRGAAFVPDYLALLASTGEASAADLAARFGIDIRTPAFWEGSLALIGQRIERYCALD